MSVILRLAPALLAVGLTLSSSAGHSAAGCLEHALTPALPQIAGPGELSLQEYTSGEYISQEYLLAAEDACTPDCGSNITAALSSGDMPGPTHLPVVAAPDEVAAWHVEIFEHVSQIREQGAVEYYCEL